MLVVGVVLSALNVWVCMDREDQKAALAERHGFEQYISTTFKEMSASTKSVQSGLAGLVDETAPTAKGALDILDNEIVPNLDYIAELGRKVVPEGEAARALHSEYLHTISGTKEDAARVRAIFADTTSPIHERRKSARLVLVETSRRFQTLDQHVIDAAVRLGIRAPAPVPAKTSP